MPSRCVSFTQQPWRGSGTPSTDFIYVSNMIRDILDWKYNELLGSILYCFQSLLGSQLISIISCLCRSEIKLYKTYLLSWNTELMWLDSKKKQWVHCDIFLALSPMKFLFQIARRRRTSKIFTTNIFNVESNLLTSATLVFKSHDETHWVASGYPNVHLAKGQVRASSGYIWPIPLRHASQWRYQDWIKSTVSLILMPKLYCHLVKYQYELNWCQTISPYYMKSFWKSGSVV